MKTLLFGISKCPLWITWTDSWNNCKIMLCFSSQIKIATIFGSYMDQNQQCWGVGDGWPCCSRLYIRAWNHWFAKQVHLLPFAISMYMNGASIWKIGCLNFNLGCYFEIGDLFFSQNGVIVTYILVRQRNNGPRPWSMTNKRGHWRLNGCRRGGIGGSGMVIRPRTSASYPESISPHGQVSEISTSQLMFP